ncbi:hypothetical protein JOB18_042220 [Solea senegalensis]|uniref:Uncharacterized protein n=1 Tax=Solea senegalensis TaxID=28829 RepID=A0AAV6QG14_SOLSE|nr:hypothetical protein JOB18_042220 [Solea senegalensis]
MLPKIHKDPVKWSKPHVIPPGRPIVSDCSSETYRTAEYLDFFLNPLSTTHPRYIKDTYDFIDKIIASFVSYRVNSGSSVSNSSVGFHGDVPSSNGRELNVPGNAHNKGGSNPLNSAPNVHSPISNSCVSYEVDSLFSLGTDGEDANSPTTTPLQPVRASPPLPRPSSLPTSFPQLTPTTRQRTLAGLMEPPSLGRRKATRHISTLRKMKDWHITVRKKVLIVGDSNVCRFPPFLDQRLQVDSYPGANFRHAAALMSKAIAITPPELIVLAFGVNHRSQRAHSTSVKQLQAALRATKLRFPLARVLVPAINFSPALPQHENFSLLALNRHIQEHCDSIPPLPREKFSTESDQIHWSRETAAAMFDHWCGHLN